MFHLAGQIFFGLIVGTLVKLMAPGKAPAGVIVTALDGLAGSIIGAFAGHLILGAHQASGLAGWILSIASSLIALSVHLFAAGKRHNHEQDLLAQKFEQK